MQSPIAVRLPGVAVAGMVLVMEVAVAVMAAFRRLSVNSLPLVRLLLL